MPLSLDSIKDEYPFAPKTLSLDGIKLSYLDEGPHNAPVIVMLHGNPTWSFYYRNLVIELRKKYRVIAPDHIGCGFSDKPQSYDYCLETHIKNFSKLVDHLGIESMSLVMHDWGGAIGMGYAVDNPEKIKSLVIFNTAAFILPKIPYRIRVCAIPLVGDFLVRGLNAFARSAITFRMATKKPEKFTNSVTKGYLAPYDSWANRIAILRFVQDIPVKPNHRSYDLLKSIDKKLNLFEQTPSLIIWGMRDFCFTELFLNEWLGKLKNVETHKMRDAGHFVVEDAFEKIGALTQNFFNKTS